jgi:hypothetical protein
VRERHHARFRRLGNIVMPAVPDSNLVPFTFQLGGVAGAQDIYTAVHQ